MQLVFGPLSLLEPQARSGAIRLLATLTEKRVPGLPEVPTLSEAGLAEVDVPTWQAVYTAARAPAAARTRLSDALANGWVRSELQVEFDRRLLVVEVASSDEVAATVARELAAWAALVDEHKLTAD